MLNTPTSRYIGTLLLVFASAWVWQWCVGWEIVARLRMFPPEGVAFALERAWVGFEIAERVWIALITSIVLTWSRRVLRQSGYLICLTVTMIFLGVETILRFNLCDEFYGGGLNAIIPWMHWPDNDPWIIFRRRAIWATEPVWLELLFFPTVLAVSRAVRFVDETLK